MAPNSDVAPAKGPPDPVPAFTPAGKNPVDSAVLVGPPIAPNNPVPVAESVSLIFPNKLPWAVNGGFDVGIEKSTFYWLDIGLNDSFLKFSEPGNLGIINGCFALL